MIKDDNKIQCGWCNTKSTAEEWEDNTLKECKSREMRRAYTSIMNVKTYRRDANTFYKCPHCERWSRGCQLSIVDTEDKALLKLGRQPVIKEV